MTFLIRYSIFVLLVVFTLRVATDSWCNHNIALMIGMVATAGFIFIM